MFFNSKKKQEERLREEKKKQAEDRKRQKLIIHEIAEYLIRSQINSEDLKNACDTIQTYNHEVNSLKRKIKTIANQKNEGSISAGTDSLLLLAADIVSDKIKDAKKKSQINELETQLIDFENNNKQKLQKAQNFLKSFPKETFEYCNTRWEDILKEIEAIKTSLNEEKLEKQKKLEAQLLEARQQELNAKMKNNEIQKQEDEKNQKINNVISAIRNLQDNIPIIQNHVSEQQKMNFIMLQTVEEFLDKIEDLKDYIPSEYINNIERCQIKLNSVFDRCENKDDIQTDVQIIKDSFEKILNNGF